MTPPFEGDYACVEWRVTMIHAGNLTLADGFVVEPTGLDVTINGATVAEFNGDRICSFRQYWDEFAVHRTARAAVRP